MNCESTRELMSAFYDQELAPDQEAAVRDHVKQCPDCAERVTQFEELSKLVAELQPPEAPAGTWASIDSLLHVQRQPHDPGAAWWRRYSRYAIAATLLFCAASIVLLAFWTRHATDEHHEMAETFGQYLDRFHEQPEVAQDVLLARYDGQVLKPEQAVRQVNFEPNAPDELPQGFSRRRIYVLKMPCCTCTQSVYQDDQGHVLVLFEHSDEQRSWFGDRSIITAQCHGKRTCLVQLDNQLAACWKSGPRYLTIVGARDVEQVAELVAYLDARRQSLQTAREAT